MFLMLDIKTISLFKTSELGTFVMNNVSKELSPDS